MTFCKIGNLDQVTFEIMKERFPVWYQKMMDQILIHKKTLLRDLSFFRDEASMNVLDSLTLGKKNIDEKVIEHYYPVFQKFERELFEEKKTEKTIKTELDVMKSSSRKTKIKEGTIKTEANENLIGAGSSSGSNKPRQNIVHLMNQSNYLY